MKTTATLTLERITPSISILLTRNPYQLTSLSMMYRRSPINFIYGKNHRKFELNGLEKGREYLVLYIKA